MARFRITRSVLDHEAGKVCCYFSDLVSGGTNLYREFEVRGTVFEKSDWSTDDYRLALATSLNVDISEVEEATPPEPVEEEANDDDQD